MTEKHVYLYALYNQIINLIIIFSKNGYNQQAGRLSQTS